ncbi:MAG: hypothetical protein JW753_01260 [Dehalococcoidia bacterium]|nr:hypothetical protein [Dehalococcoidia bacterium]
MASHEGADERLPRLLLAGGGEWLAMTGLGVRGLMSSVETAVAQEWWLGDESRHALQDI